MAVQQFEGTLVPEDLVERTMTLQRIHGEPLFRFTEGARARILERLPAGATYTAGGDHEQFDFDGQSAIVLLDVDRMEALGHLTDEGGVAPETPEAVLRQNVIVLGEGPQEGRAAIEQTVLEAMDFTPVGQEEAPRDTEGGRKRRKTKKRKTKKRKTLRRRRNLSS